MEIVSLFSGCGGLDLGFKDANFNVIWANEYDKYIWDTYIHNHPETVLDKRSILNIDSNEIPECIGVVGGPPCQSWSNAGSGRGINDPRGKLFDEFVRVLKDKQPLFFLAENVEGMMSLRHAKSFETIKRKLTRAGYRLSAELVNSADYGVPQNRKRIIFVGYRKDLGIKFKFPPKNIVKRTVYDALFDLKDTALPSQQYNSSNKNRCIIPNHEYWLGEYSYIFMSRNRVLDWNSQSYTIQASGRQVSIHPQAPQMVKVKKDEMEFVKDKKKLYRRLTIRECARLQTFPDKFVFHYDKLEQGYKMVGNAVPVSLAYAMAMQIKSDLQPFLHRKNKVIECEQNMDLLQRNHVLV